MASILSSAFAGSLRNNDSPDGAGLQDYRHASNLFLPGDFRLSPKFRFLFHTVFFVNSNIAEISQLNEREVGALVKSADLPSINFDVEEMRQYNRKTHVVNSVSYTPCNMTIHDDNESNVSRFMDAYFKVYSGDSSAGQYNLRDGSGLDAGYLDVFVDEATNASRGMESPRTLSYNGQNVLNAIGIYSLAKGRGRQYLFVNPVIESIGHGSHDVSDSGGIMEYSISFRYETFLHSLLDASEIPALVTETYDGSLSSIGRNVLSSILTGNSISDSILGGIESIAGDQIRQYAGRDAASSPDSRESAVIRSTARSIPESIDNSVSRQDDSFFPTVSHRRNTNNNPRRNATATTVAQLPHDRARSFHV